MDMVKVKGCDVINCSYNKSNSCSAMAITVGDAQHPSCDTFTANAGKGGVGGMQGGVGACKVNSCRYNQSLECSAPGIKVGFHEQHADCSTFQPK